MKANAVIYTWDFVEKYYPNYSSSNEIAQHNDLSIIVNGEENAEEKMKDYGICEDEAQITLNELSTQIYEGAIYAFMQTKIFTFVEVRKMLEILMLIKEGSKKIKGHTYMEQAVNLINSFDDNLSVARNCGKLLEI